jgi:hypothetical protein
MKRHMKKPAIIIGIILIRGLALADERKAADAVVESIDGIPIFMYSTPIANFEVIGKAVSFGEHLKFALDDQSNDREKAEHLVAKTLQKVEDGEKAPFDAIIIDLNRDTTRLIRFKGEKSTHATVTRVKDVPIYFFAQPTVPYLKVADLPRDMSRRAERNLLFDRINSMVGRTVKKEKNGAIEQFDALIFDPETLSAVAIRFDEEDAAPTAVSKEDNR